MANGKYSALFETAIVTRTDSILRLPGKQSASPPSPTKVEAQVMLTDPESNHGSTVLSSSSLGRIALKVKGPLLLG